MIAEPNWEKARENLAKFGKTFLKPSDQRIFDNPPK